MQINSLKINNLRNIQSADFDLHPELNLFVGENGAGKTSVLEALVVLAKGRSFRAGRVEVLIGPHGDRFRVVANTRDDEGTEHRLGLERDAGTWTARFDGNPVQSLGELARALPVVVMEPNSHLLVSGPPDERRRYIDWGVFHVKHTYLDTWRRFGRVVRQRNAALKSGNRPVIEALDSQAVELGEAIHVLRSRQIETLSGKLLTGLEALGPDLSDIQLEYAPGWRGDSLEEALQRSLERDMDRGATSVGPHRADLHITHGGRPAREVLSRGEQKLVAAALLISQAASISESGATPALLLDDLASEFDQRHLENMARVATEAGYQLWITGTSREPYGFLKARAHRLFHVEHGRIQQAQERAKPA